MKQFLNAAVVISFFSVIASAIWLVWDQREIASKAVATALIVFATVLVCKLVWVVVKEL